MICIEFCRCFYVELYAGIVIADIRYMRCKTSFFGVPAAEIFVLQILADICYNNIYCKRRDTAAGQALCGCLT